MSRHRSDVGKACFPDRSVARPRAPPPSRPRRLACRIEKYGPDWKDLTRPLPDVHEHLRRRLAIERELAYVFDHTDNFPGPGIVADVDMDADRVLIRQFAARRGFIDQQHARPTRRVTLGQAPTPDDARAHNGEVVPADEGAVQACRPRTAPDAPVCVETTRFR